MFLSGYSSSLSSILQINATFIFDIVSKNRSVFQAVDQFAERAQWEPYLCLHSIQIPVFCSSSPNLQPSIDQEFPSGGFQDANLVKF